jgi:hypothetical protein
MASSFAQGFRLGGDMYNQAERNKLAREQEERAARESAARLEQMGLQTDALRNAQSREREATGIRREMADFTQGVDRQATNQALDADFDMANQAAMQGMALPAVRGGSNAANEAGLTVRNAVDPTAPQFQQGLAGLRSRLALTTGDDAGFAQIQQAETARVSGLQDSEFARNVMADPTGEAAVQARTFINNQSQRLSTKVDPKTGITTFALVKGDGYDEIKVSPSDLGKIAVGFRRLERGDIGGLDVIAAVNKDLAAVAREELKLQLDVGKANNDATSKVQSIKNDNARLGVLRGNAEISRMGAAQYFTGADGNTYASVPTMTREGLRFETVRVNPEGIAMSRVGGAGGDPKPQDVKEEGTRVTIGGRLMVADGMGGYVPTDGSGKPLGVLPSQRPMVLKEAGIPDNLIGQLQWNKEGTAVGINGKRYTLDELKQIPKDNKVLQRNMLEADELNRQSMLYHSALNRQLNAVEPPAAPSRGLGPRITYRPDDRAPSIYAGPEEWEAYRRYQQLQQTR